MAATVVIEEAWFLQSEVSQPGNRFMEITHLHAGAGQTIALGQAGYGPTGGLQAAPRVTSPPSREEQSMCVNSFILQANNVFQECTNEVKRQLDNRPAPGLLMQC